MKDNVIITNTPEETKKLAGDLITSEIKGPDLFRGGDFKKSLILALYGELGSGKTTFVQGLAKGFGIAKRIISPTFTIIRCYEVKSQTSRTSSDWIGVKSQNHNSKLKNLARFYHIDLYRINSKQDVKNLGVEEILDDETAIVVVEWAERMKCLLPKKRIDINFEYLGENKRKIIITQLSS